MPPKNFAPFPVLVTENLILRQLLNNDAEQILALRSNPEVNKYLDRQPGKTIEDAENFISRITENLETNDSVYWVITSTSNKTFTGTICLFNFSDKEGKCEIGYELLPDFQGQGIMQEAANKVIEYAIHHLNIQLIEACTHKNNSASSRLLGKLAFIQSTVADQTNPDYYVFTLPTSK